MTRMNDLLTRGQSVWLDNIDRAMLTSGELKKRIQDGLRGMTSNPAIFEKAISSGVEYDAPIRHAMREGKTMEQIAETLMVEDVQHAADHFLTVYDSSKGLDGFVSIEVAPSLARDTQRTIDDARRLWTLVGRPNAMIKIPGTVEGLPAIQQCLQEGINVNVTLIFSVERYRYVWESFVTALERRAAEGKPLGVASVASFFVSRIDTVVDKLLQEKIQTSRSQGEKDQLLELFGKVAVANAKVAYQFFKKSMGQSRWEQLKKRGAQPQRPLWASTGTKNPHYSDLLYMDSLIGPNTVNTLPPATLSAFLDHGTVAGTLDSGVEDARQTLDRLASVRINLQHITETLEADGISLFAQAHEKLLAGLRTKKEALELSGERK